MPRHGVSVEHSANGNCSMAQSQIPHACSHEQSKLAFLLHIFSSVHKMHKMHFVQVPRWIFGYHVGAERRQPEQSCALHDYLTTAVSRDPGSAFFADRSCRSSRR